MPWAIRRSFIALLLLPLLGGPGCTCGGGKGASSEAGGTPGAPVATASASSPGATLPAGPELSAPIGGAVVPRSKGAVLVAGLGAARGVVTLTRIEADGHASFTRDILDHVGWAPDASVDVFAAPDGGAFVLFRGLRSGKSVRLLAAIDPSGAPRGGTEETAGGACATEDGVAWVGRDHGERYSVFRRGWAESASRASLALNSDDGDVLFSCGTHNVFPLVEGEGSVTLARGRGDAGRGAPLTIAEAPAGGEMHDHVEYTQGDDFGMVLPDATGTLALRELHGETLTPWRRLHTRLGPDAAVVAADADDESVYVVSTREESAACPDGGPHLRLVVTRAPRKGGAADVETATGPLECGGDAGPFWTGIVRGALVVGWAQRRADKGGALDPPWAGVAFVRVVAASSSARALAVERVASPADAIVQAGCDEDACYAAALTRPEGTDGMVPGRIRVLRY